jgi:manganese-dependent ADP-ribose/CDP-alcohol diphosphatase
MKRRTFIASAAASTLFPPPAMAKPSESPLLRFGVISDAQYADADAWNERHYRASPEKLRRAVETIRAAKPAFTLHLGDLIDRDFRSFGVMLPILDGLGHPVHHLLGNHEYDVTDKEKARVAATLGMPHDYYTFRSSGIRFVMLDTTSLSVYKHPEAAPETAAAERFMTALQPSGHPGAKPWNGGVSEVQLDWLERELSAADAAKERVIVCGHHPLLPADMHQLWNHEAVLAILDRHPCVAAWFNGHNHAGHFIERRGIPYLTFRSLLHEPETSAFALVEVHPDRIVITGHGREVSRVLPIAR